MTRDELLQGIARQAGVPRDDDSGKEFTKRELYHIYSLIVQHIELVEEQRARIRKLERGRSADR